MLNEDIIKLDRGRINARILAKEVKADFRPVEAASRKIPAAFYSPEVKRLFVRFFHSLQLNVHYISVFARAKLPNEIVEQVEAAIRSQIEKVSAEFDEAIRGAELLCQREGISSLASYDAAPLALEVRVISPLSRRYLELMTKLDQLMPMLETLAIDEVIALRELDIRRGRFKRLVKGVAGSARQFASGLRRRTAEKEAASAQQEAAQDSGVAAQASAPGIAVESAPADAPAIPADSPAVADAPASPTSTTSE